MGQLLKKHIKNEKGLTLIELLAVIVILGIIAAIAIPSIANIIEKSRFDAIKADGIQVLNSAKLYVSGNGEKSTGITEADLEEYLDNETTLATGYTVSVVNGNMQLTATGKKGNITVAFKNASIEQINKATKDDSGTTTIGD